MQILSISFGKKLIAKCSVKTANAQEKPCEIYELSKKDDIDYFCRLKENKQWQNSEYTEITNQMMLSPLLNKGLKIFSLESKNEGCIGYICTQDFDFIPNKTYVEFLETCPMYSSKNKKREIKYIGQTLMAFVVALAQKNKKDKVCVPTIAPKSKRFYGKACGFRQDYKDNDGLIINRQNYNKFLRKHEEKTGKEITFIA